MTALQRGSFRVDEVEVLMNTSNSDQEVSRDENDTIDDCFHVTWDSDEEN